MAKETPEHGTPARYRLGCRCDPCRAWKSDAQAKYRKRRAEREGKPAPIVTLVPRPTFVPTSTDDFGPIETAARRALAAVDGAADDPLAMLRREVAYRAAAVMDNPKAAPFFKSASDVLRATVADLVTEQPSKGGEADELTKIMASLGGTSGSGRGRRGAPSVDDAAQSVSGDDL